jgi:hypothetical protein
MSTLLFHLYLGLAHSRRWPTIIMCDLFVYPIPATRLSRLIESSGDFWALSLLWEMNVSSVMCVRLSDRPHRRSRILRNGFSWNFILGTFIVEKIYVWPKSDRNNRHLARRLNSFYVVDSDVCRSTKQKITHCCVHMTTLNIRLSFCCKQNGWSVMCVRESKYLNAPRCYVMRTLPVWLLCTLILRWLLASAQISDLKEGENLKLCMLLSGYERIALNTAQ